MSQIVLDPGAFAQPPLLEPDIEVLLVAALVVHVPPPAGHDIDDDVPPDPTEPDPATPLTALP